jgi:hypothetical protein
MCLPTCPKTGSTRPPWHCCWTWPTSADWPQHRDAMFAGAAINTTENRPVMHVCCEIRLQPISPILRSVLLIRCSKFIPRPCPGALARWTPCWPMPSRAGRPGHHRCGQYRHRRLRSGAADGGAGAGGLWTPGAPLSLCIERGRPRAGSGAEEVQGLRARCF